MPSRVILFFLILVFLISPVSMAGDIRKIRGESRYASPRTETPEQARKNAIRDAKINALEIAFGATVSERTVSVSETLEGATVNSAHSHGESLINGEWLRDLKEPEITTELTEYGTLYFVKVYGEAREMKYNRIEVDCRLLCNGTDPHHDCLRGNQYYEGENLYVYFNSPVDGWVAIYLVDDDEQHTTQCLVPYDGQRASAYPIIANKEYVFFSKRMAEPQYVDYVTGMVVESRKKTDFNIMYVIFSPNEFIQVPAAAYRASNHEDDRDIPVNLMPRETTHTRFDKWLHKLRCKDADLQPIQFTFSISKK